MPSDPSVPKALNVFLSSTVEDYETYRLAVSDKLRRYSNAACFLSEEDWVGGYDDTVAMCEARVCDADGFILLLGHWYGSMPPGSEKSITQLEFEAARQHWPGDYPPIAVMRPRSGSKADAHLADLAAAILGRRAADAAFDRAAHDRKRLEFQNSVVGAWRRVNDFSTREDLTFKATTCVERWRGRTPARAADGLVDVDVREPGAGLTDAALGRLGRASQLSAARMRLAVVASERDVPAVALVAHGPEDAGHVEFLAALTEAVLPLTHCHPGTLPTRQTSVDALSSWVAQTCGLAQRDGVTTPEALAEGLFMELKRGPRAFILNRISRLNGGIQTFAETFWAPLYRRLQQLTRGQPFQHRLVAVIADMADDIAAVEAVTSAPADEEVIDCSRPLRLPRLGPITRTQVLTWLDDMQIDQDKRGQLADFVLTDDNGADDRVPTRVFRRLREQWPD